MDEIKLSGRFRGATNKMMTGRRMYTVEFTSGNEDLDIFLDNHPEELLHFDIRVGKRERTRSLSANAYAWALITELARKLKLTKEEVYKEEIRGLGIGDQIPIKPEALPEFERRWESHGTGWMVERIGPCTKVNPETGEAEEYIEILAIYGSSTFTTGQMSDFIDKIIRDCHDQKIPVLPIDQIEEMMDVKEEPQ